MEDSVVAPADKTYWWRQFIFRWGISAPGLIAQIVFGWMPLIIAVVVSFQHFHFQKSTWAGMSNYEAIFEDPLSTPFSLKAANMNYERSVNKFIDKNGAKPNILLKGAYKIRSGYYGLGVVWRNTFFYASLTLGLIFFIPIIVSILLMEMPPWLIRIMMILWFVPIASMAAMIVIKYAYHVDYGLLNGLLEGFYNFIDKPPSERVFPRYLNSPDTAMLCIVLPSLVMYMPGLVYITALQAIPQDLYDAAEIDGCGFLQKIWNITLPRLRPIILTMLIFSLISAFQVFQEIMIMTQGGPSNSTITVSYYIYKLSFDYLQLGKGNALAVLFFIFLMALTVIQRMYFKEDPDTGTSKKTLRLLKKK